MHSTLFLTFAAALTGLVSADDKSTTVPYFGAVIGLTQPTYSGTVGSVAGINAKATTYHISCEKDAPKSLCQIDKPWTMIQGEETYSLTGVYTAWSSKSNAVTATHMSACSFKHFSESASCSMSVGVTGTQGGGKWSSSTSTKTSIASDKVTRYGLKVTGGLESFTKPQATESPGAAAAVGPVNAKAVVTGMPLAGAAAVAVAAMF
ncbi:hypothetical protein EYZ11_013256 [Aspergillus tanneri]|uniref:Ig-like domain-containing protein n=1 Tax=Aspergillus tanneri TaxID=1220188 RepID=A0A4S3J0B7_9EURO|nr:uncharacterized protein ATNIH1004_000125 [Aspergillus tanneri]KAA8651247.1 hypothetical protein ATNIH1004_000125 [Aspergillus tanneri]THC87298.1 hypothetical protein EYZ11_013256 [Aspergillus tanneri]